MTAVTALERLIGLRRSARAGVLLLIAGNLVPLAGVLWWGWDAYVIVFVYWMENGVIGLVNVLKIRREEGAKPGTGRYLSNFFVIHYGAFWLVHGLLLFLLTGFPNFDASLPRISVLGIALAIVTLTVSHFGNFYFVFLRERAYLTTNPMRQMFSPYPRLIALHVVLILGAVLAGTLGQPAILVLLLVLFKIGFELAVFAFDHQVAVTTRGAPALATEHGPDGRPQRKR